jgi:hypothetical protein
MSEGLEAVRQAADGGQRKLTKFSAMRARITFEGDHDQALATATKAAAAARNAMEVLGYKPDPLHTARKSRSGSLEVVVRTRILAVIDYLNRVQQK